MLVFSSNLFGPSFPEHSELRMPSNIQFFLYLYNYISSKNLHVPEAGARECLAFLLKKII